MYGFCFLCLFLCGACGDEEEETGAYPSLITEFADIYTDNNGNGHLLVTDKGKVYSISHPLQGLQPSVAYRIICGYVLTGTQNGEYQVVDLYTVEKITLLERVEANNEEDAPTQVTSIWRGGAYLNFHFTPKTQGGQQEWGYRMDGTRNTETGKTYCLSLYHRQPNDPYSYSTTVYASLPINELGELREGDSISFTVRTFSGEKTWQFAY